MGILSNIYNEIDRLKDKLAQLEEQNRYLQLTINSMNTASSSDQLSYPAPDNPLNSGSLQDYQSEQNKALVESLYR
jgi:regulator of replication initiation timing